MAEARINIRAEGWVGAAEVARRQMRETGRADFELTGGGIRDLLTTTVEEWPEGMAVDGSGVGVLMAKEAMVR